MSTPGNKYFFEVCVTEPSQPFICQWFGSFGGAEFLAEIEREVVDSAISCPYYPNAETVLCSAQHQPGERCSVSCDGRWAIPPHWLVEFIGPASFTAPQVCETCGEQSDGDICSKCALTLTAEHYQEK